MKFGSRMDVFLPPNATLSVSVGQKVRGGETVIAVLHSATERIDHLASGIDWLIDRPICNQAN